MLTVAAVLRTGEFKGRVYTPDHVVRLRDQVAAHLGEPHRFVCLSDIAVSCDSLPLRNDWPGWWSKLELFRPGLFDGRVLYLDLDVTVVGGLDDLAHCAGSFVAIREWLNPLLLNSSVMTWDAGCADHLYNLFTPADMERFNGDQGWITKQMGPGAARFPRQWCQSYKADVLRWKVLSRNCRVVVHTGTPKPWDLPVDYLEGLRVA